MSTKIRKSREEEGFTVVYQSAAQDRRLSLKARGLFLLLRSLPDEWTLTQEKIAFYAGCGVSQVRAALRELRNTGYLVAEQSHNERGKFGDAVYVLQSTAPEGYEPLFQKEPSGENQRTDDEQGEPFFENQRTAAAQNEPFFDFPRAENPRSENRGCIKIYSSNNISPQTPQGGQARAAFAPENDGANQSDDGAKRDDSGAKSGDSDATASDVNRADDGAKGRTRSRSAPRWKPERFEKFWTFYREHGRGEARQKAVSAWDRLKPDDSLIAVMGQALRRQVSSDAWRRGIGIPYASSWLNGRRWEDSPSGGPSAPDEPPTEVYGVWHN